MEPETQNGGPSVVKTVVWLVVLLLIVGGFVLYGSKGKGGEKVSKEPIKIGLMVPLTGDGAVYGEPARNISQLAVEEINSSGGIGGRNIELVIEDSKCNGKDATNAAQKLINVDQVQVIIGGFCSSESLATVPFATEKKVALFSPGSSSPDLTGISPYFFRNYPSDASQGKILAEFAFNQKGWKTIAFMQEQTDYALGIYKIFASTFEGLGGKIIKEEAPSNTTDFRSQLAKLKAVKADALFVDTQTPAVAERIFKQVQDLKWTIPLIANDVVAGDPKIVETYKALLEGMLTAEFGIDPTNQKFVSMIAAYKAKYGTEPPFQGYAQTEYDAVYMLRDGIIAVGYSGEKIAQWSRTVKNWEGASGKITIEQSGDRASGHVLKVVKEGKVEVLLETPKTEVKEEANTETGGTQ